MHITIDQVIDLSKNITAIAVIIYWFVDTIRNWGGTPELKLLKQEMKKTHEHFERLLEILSRQQGARE